MSTEQPHSEVPLPRRRWRLLRFSLRSLLLAMTVVCIASGWWVSRAIRQRTAVRRFYELTAHRKGSPSEELTTMGYRHRGKDDYYKPIFADWMRPLRSALGDEAFGEITGVQILDTPATDDDVRLIAEFPTVERVWLSRTHVTDDGLKHLRRCPKLKMLIVDEVPITDEGVEHLAALQELESLSLSGTKVTDQSLETLAKLPNLKELWLRNTAITNDGYLKLEKALPNCQIQADVPAYFRKSQQLYW